MDISRSSESSSSHSHSSSEPFGQRTASWALSLDNLLADEDGIKAFSEFLERECSGENLAFWLDCRKLRSLTQPKEIRMKVRSMYSNYFALTASQAINVDSEARIAADKDVLSPSVDAFKEAEDHIYQLMRDDSYPRFLRSDCYSQMVKGEITVMMKNKKDNHIFSRYKTTLKHKLSSSGKKQRNKNTPGLPSTPIAPLKQLNNNNNNYNNYSNNKLLPPVTPKSCIANGGDKYTSSYLTDESDINPTSTNSCLVNKFLSDWNLLEECEFDQFFSDIVSSSQRVPAITTSSKANQSNSHPCLIDSIANITRTIDTRSPSVGDLRPSVMRPPPPPPPPPVPRRTTEGKAPCPPPVPSRCSLYV